MNNFFLEAARDGRMFNSHNTTAGAVTVLHATCTGLVLENPHGSGKDLIVESMSFVGTTLSTIREIGVGIAPAVSAAVSTSTTAAVIHNGKLSGSNAEKGAGRAYSIATLSSTPVWFCPLGNARQTTTSVEGAESFIKQFDGTLVVAPGMYVAFSTLTATAVGLCQISWAEADIII